MWWRDEEDELVAFSSSVLFSLETNDDWTNFRVLSPNLRRFDFSEKTPRIATLKETPPQVKNRSKKIKDKKAELLEKTTTT